MAKKAPQLIVSGACGLTISVPINGVRGAVRLHPLTHPG
jgi:hypothetical protein